MKKTKTNLLTAAIAGLLIGAGTGCTVDDSSSENGASQNSKTTMPSPDAAKDAHSCKGLNKCAGKGGCGSGDNGCKGKNSCKGKGGCAVPSKH